MREGRGVHRVLVGKPEGKTPLGRLRRRWEDNIKMDLQKMGGGCGDRMELAQDTDSWRALVSTVMNFRVQKMRGISWLAAEPVSFSRRTLLHGVSKYVIEEYESKRNYAKTCLTKPDKDGKKTDFFFYLDFDSENKYSLNWFILSAHFPNSTHKIDHQSTTQRS